MSLKDELEKQKIILMEAERIAHIGGWEWDLKEDRFYCTEGWRRINGVSKITMTREELLNLAHPEDLGMVMESLEGACRGVKSYDIKHRIIKEDSGEVRYVHSRGEVVYDRKENPVKVYGVSVDITESKRREEELIAYEKIFSSSQDLMSLVDREYCYRIVNETYGLIHETSIDQIVGWHVSDILGEKAFHDVVKPRLDRCFKGERVNYAEWFYFPEKGYRYMDVTYSPCYLDESTIMGAATVVRDITERKQAEEALREQKDLLEGLIDGISDVVAIQYPDHTIERYNKAGYEMLGMTPEEVKGKKCYELIGRYQECEECATRKAIETKELTVIEKYIPEVEMYLNCRSNPVLDEEGNVVRIVEQLQDITERKKQEDALKRERDYMFKVFDSMSQYVVVDSKDYIIEYLNRPAKEDFGDLVGKVCYREVGREAPCNQCPIPKIVNEKHPGPIKYNVEAFGRIMEASATPLVNLDGSISVLKVLEDMTEEKEKEERIRYMNVHDELTGLYNRAFFEEEIRRLEKSKDYPITIIVVDVDGFKLVNDALGHARGDELLKACSEVLKKSCRQTDFLARIGGDEFVIVLPQTSEEEGEQVGKRIRSNIDLHNVKDPSLPMSLSQGIATEETRKNSLQETYKRADILMRRAKLSKDKGSRSQLVNILMAALEERDYITEGHAQRLSRLSQRVGEKIGLSYRRLGDLALLSRVHDLGKVGTPDGILFKEGPLTKDEWVKMKEHPRTGYRIALASPDLSGVASLILQHHERWDGSGYPLGIKGEEIPVECRILAIVDAYDAMTNNRPYRKALSKDEAVEELKRWAGKQFDPYLVEVFLEILKEEAEV